MIMGEMTDQEFSEYCREVSSAYFAEEEEFNAGVHSSQVAERIKKWLKMKGLYHKKITFLDWNVDGPKVKVSLNGNFFGVFNYNENDFKEISNYMEPDKVIPRLNYTKRVVTVPVYKKEKM